MLQEMNKVADVQPVVKAVHGLNSHPTSITNIVNIFSASVFAATLPKPTLVRLLNVKYSAVTYFACTEHEACTNSQIYN